MPASPKDRFPSCSTGPTLLHALQAVLGATPVLAIGLLALACATPSSAVNPYRTLSSNEVAHLELVPLDSLVLTIPSGVIQGITDFQRHDGRYYLLDGHGKMVHVFDAEGSHHLSFGGDGSWPGEFYSPRDLAFDGDEVIIIDNFTTAFGDDGSFREVKRFPLPRQPWSFEVAEGNLYVLTAGTADSAGGGWELLTVLDANFEVVGRGCRIDAKSVASMKSHGMLSAFPPSDIAVLDGRVYCVQPVSPIVQVMDADGKSLGAIAVAPPFYRAPVDRPFTANQKDLFEFGAGFTAHNTFYPVRDGPGFVSVYSSFDLEAGAFHYWLFRCTLAADWGVDDCAMMESTRKPVLVTPEGDVFLEEEGEPNAPPVVGIYHLSVERASR